MKKLLLILFVFISLNVFGQIKVKENSFRKIDGFVMLDKYEHTDMNNAPMALIKISTENINAEQRRKFTFKGNLATFFDVHFEPGEIYLYVSAAAATFIEIIHDDYGKTEFTLPYDLCDFCGYEMVIVRPNADYDNMPQINYLVINADQDNAAIYIDGNYVGDKEASRSFEIGSKHTWKIDCKLYHSESGEVTITSGDAIEISKTLRPAYGYINVTTNPEMNAVVFIDNERVGTTPYKSDKMPSGTYSVRIVKEMYDAVENTFIIEDGATTLAEMNLSAGFMKLTVKADPDSDIYIDSEYKGKGEWNGEVLFGTHYLEARKENHKPAVMKVELDKNSTSEIVLETPRPITGHIDINTSPMKADIYLDGKHYGTTPKVISNIIIGVHKLKLEKDGYVALEKDIVVEEGEMLSLNEKLLEDAKQQPAKQKDDKVKSVDGKTESVNFLTLNAAYSVAPQISFGFTYGQVKKIGWFVSAMTGTSFEGFNVNSRSYEEAALTGETASSRLSITGGVALRLGTSPVYLKAGAGYGMRVRACETIHGDYVEYTPDTYKGLEMTAGLQFNLKNITLGVDAVTTNFKYLELKLGVGINWN